MEDNLPYDVIITNVKDEQEREVNLINMEGLYVICQTQLVYVINQKDVLLVEDIMAWNYVQWEIMRGGKVM